MGCTSSTATYGTKLLSSTSTEGHRSHSDAYSFPMIEVRLEIPNDLSVASSKSKHVLLTADPDLMWRQIKRQTFEPSGFNNAVIDLHEILAYPMSWNCEFINDSETSCIPLGLSIIALSLNLAVRAARLASAFGLSLENECPEPSSDVSLDHPLPPSDIYPVLGVPDFSWRLVRRCVNIDSQQDQTKFSAKFSRRRDYKPRVCQLLARSVDSREGDGSKDWTTHIGFYDVETSNIAINLSDQLARLEQHYFTTPIQPTETFGWKVPQNYGEECMQASYVAVQSPGGDAHWLCPEELILNVAEWVRQTYSTSPNLL